MAPRHPPVPVARGAAPAMAPPRKPMSPPPAATRAAEPAALVASLSRLRQRFAEVAAVFEGLTALRSSSGEDALIELAMLAQGHEQTLERVWTQLDECERLARAVELPPPAPPPAPPAPAPPAQASTAPPSRTPSFAPAPAGELELAESPLSTEPAPVSVSALGATEDEEDGPVTQVDVEPSRVLLVDDDPTVLRAFRRVLQAQHEIVTARDGAEALRLVLQGAPVDAIICDIGMPKLDGPAFFSELFELRPQLMPRVVFCTGGVPNEKTQRLLDRLQAPLLFKPVAAADLLRAIDLVRSR